MRRALGAHQHPAAELPLPAPQIGEHSLVVRRRQVRERRPAPRGDEEIAVERHRPLRRRPRDQRPELGAVALGDRGLDDEIEPLPGEPRQRALRIRERAAAVPEVVVIGGAERIDAHRDPAHARCLERRDPFVGEQRPVRAHDHRGALPGGIASDVGQVLAQQRLAAREDQHRGGAHREHLVDDAEARRRVELSSGAFAGTRRDVAMRALQVAAPRQVPGHHVGDVVHVSRPPAPRARARSPPSPPGASCL